MRSDNLEVISREQLSVGNAWPTPGPLCPCRSVLTPIHSAPGRRQPWLSTSLPLWWPRPTSMHRCQSCVRLLDLRRLRSRWRSLIRCEYDRAALRPDTVVPRGHIAPMNSPVSLPAHQPPASVADAHICAGVRVCALAAACGTVMCVTCALARALPVSRDDCDPSVCVRAGRARARRRGTRSGTRSTSRARSAMRRSCGSAQRSSSTAAWRCSRRWAT